MTQEITVVVGYIMYYDLLENKINGSFFSKIDKAIEIAEEFVEIYKQDELNGWETRDFEETINEFIKIKL